MVIFEEGKEVKIENVLHFRKKMTQEQMMKEMIDIGNKINNLGVLKVGPLITITYGVEIIDNQQIMDMEVYIPLSKKINELEYSCDSIFEIHPKIIVHYKGDYKKINDVYRQIGEYVKNNNLNIDGLVYCAQISENSSIESIANVELKFYVV